MASSKKTPTPFGWGNRQNAVPPQYLHDGAAAMGVAMLAYKENGTAPRAQDASEGVEESKGAGTPAVSAPRPKPSRTPGIVAGAVPQKARATTPFGWESRQNAVPPHHLHDGAAAMGVAMMANQSNKVTTVGTTVHKTASGGGTSGNSAGAKTATPFGWNQRHNTVPPQRLHDGSASLGVAMMSNQAAPTTRETVAVPQVEPRAPAVSTKAQGRKQAQQAGSCSIVAVQMEPAFLHPAVTWARIESKVEAAAAVGADVVVWGEGTSWVQLFDVSPCSYLVYMCGKLQCRCASRLPHHADERFQHTAPCTHETVGPVHFGVPDAPGV